jgi:nicotinate-nucleotide--dimethylbenzimidazole phosphoribosyltransferase
VTALLELGADVVSTDADAAAAARVRATPGSGRLAELAGWLAATQGEAPPHGPARARCVVVGSITARLATLADATGVGVRPLEPPADSPSAFAAGAALADEEADAGTDLLVVAAHDPGIAPAVTVGVLAGAEPVALLPRGAAAVDTDAWIARADQLRDARRRTIGLRRRPDELLAALDAPRLAAAVGCVLRAAGRRTAVVLDGTAAVAAALLCVDSQPRAAEWFQVADSSDDPVHRRAVEQLRARPLLDLGTSSGDGTAGVLAVALLRAAVVGDA